MPLSPSFTITPLTNPAAFTITDTSTGSDVAITDRVIILYNVDNSVYGTFDFPLSIGSAITIAPLLKDVALTVKVNWNNAGGSALYTVSQIFAFTQYGEQFYYQLTQNQTSNPNVVNDNNYYGNKLKLRVELDSAVQAINEGGDIYSAQGCINRYNYLISTQNFFF